jgi:uncharacterized protein (DUF2252 family)
MSKTVAKRPPISLLNDWIDLLSPPVSYEDRIAAGKAMRIECPRTSHGQWKPPEDRPTALELLRTQDAARIDYLTPLRYSRMMQSPFAFYRGSAIVMASDLSTAPRSGLRVQLCGDCHLSNFGIFATPERNVIFDLNDFDETLPGPFEWDLKRLAASFVVAAESNNFSARVGERCVLALARTYRKKMEEYSRMNTLEIWYQRIDWEYLITRIKNTSRRQWAIGNLERLKQKRSHLGALNKLTEVVNGKRRIRDNPPFVYHSDRVTDEQVGELLNTYAHTLWQSRQTLLQRYHFVDLAAKIVGVGSVGTLAAVVLLRGEGGDDDYIFLQLKEAAHSVLEAYIGGSEFANCGERIVNGQRVLQASSDMFLGWAAGPRRDFYVRQLMDLKDSVPIEELDQSSMEQYAEVCALGLARAHARTGDPAMISGYLGKADTFDRSLILFADAYCKQNRKDYDLMLAAIKSGEISTECNIPAHPELAAKRKTNQ